MLRGFLSRYNEYRGSYCCNHYRFIVSYFQAYDTQSTSHFVQRRITSEFIVDEPTKPSDR